MVDLILPALNEADAIENVLARVPSVVHPIIVDNGSTDATADIARACGAEVVVEPERGFGAACAKGLQTATSTVVGFMDCDGSLDALDLPRVAAPVVAGTADLVLGARHPARRAVWPAHARVANRVLARELRRWLHLPLSDLGPMRAARRLALLELRLTDRRFGWPLEMVVAAARRGWRIREVPVTYAARIGRSKVTGTPMGTLRCVADMTRVLR